MRRVGRRKYLYCCVAILSCLVLSQCAAVGVSPPVEVQEASPQDEPREHLIRAQTLLVQGDYAAALEENRKVLSLSGNYPPGDEARYYIALVYTYPGNPKRDYVKSIAAFKRLIKECPQSTWAEQAKIWVQVIEESENMTRTATSLGQENEKLKRTATSLGQENEKVKRTATSLSQENDKLKQIIDESKKVDLEIEERKRDTVK